MKARVDGEAILYQQFDVAYEIDLDRAFDLLASSAPERRKPVRGEATAIQIANPPVTVGLGTEPVSVAGETREAEASAQLFDFGVVSLRLAIQAPPGIPWSEFCAFGAALDPALAGPRFQGCLERLLRRIGPALVRPGRAPVIEEYAVFRVGRLEDASGAPFPLDALPDDQIARLLLSESRPLAPGSRQHLLSPRFSYYDDDLAVLAWSSALVVEPDGQNADVQYVLEFANAQLLELRYYDTILDAEVPRMYDEIAAARRGFHLAGRRYSRLLGALQARVADATEAVERVDNALKVTEDVFLARIYEAALDLFRGPTWRRGIDRKVAIVRDAYTMLNAESQARRAEVLEITIVLLIALEIVLALLWR